MVTVLKGKMFIGKDGFSYIARRSCVGLQRR